MKPFEKFTAGVVAFMVFMSFATFAFAQSAPSSAPGIAIIPNASTVAVSDKVMKATPGNLYSLNLTTGASAGYFLIFDAASAPVDGTVTPKKCYSVAATSSLSLLWREVPLRFNTGIVVSFSTTGCYTKTASVTAFISGETK